jgi:putative ABC transport system substrate-binding protein
MPTTRATKPTRLPRLGYLARGGGASTAVPAPFLDGLRELGYVEGEQIVIEARATERPEQYPELVADLLRLPVDLLVSSDSVALAAAKAATHTVPIVMVGANDPVGTGLIDNLGRPGGNLTGTTLSSPGLVAKQLELLKEAVPAISRVAVLRDGSRAPSQETEERSAAARALGLELLFADIRQVEDFENALSAVLGDGADALVPARQPIFNIQRARIIDWAAARRLPAMYPLREYADEGGLMAYGVEQASLAHRAAAYVDKILNGTSPADLPVERPAKFDFVVNLKTARAIGLTIPQLSLQQATQVIQ